jgi:Putative beta-barrel porin-2, OmpL-like. bbp2
MPRGSPAAPGPLRAGVVAIAVAVFAAPAAAQSQASGNPFENVRFGVTFEGYYEYASNHPPDRVLLLHAYDTRADTFSLQQAAVVLESVPNVGEGRPFGARIDLQFGQATDTVQGSPANEPRPAVYRNLWQAYGTYVLPVGRGLQADFGKYASSLGYETNYAKDDQAFSRAYLFDFLPFYHAGVRLTLPVNDDLTVLYMLSNGIQQTEDFNNFKSSQIAAVIKPLPALAWTINDYFGQEQPDSGQPNGPNGFFHVYDTYVTVTPAPDWTFGVDANHTTNQVHEGDPAVALNGLGVYGRCQVTRVAGLGFRYERLDDQGLFAGIPQVLQEGTATAEYRLSDGFLARAEFRSDWSSRPFFTGPSGRADRLRRQNTLLFGGVWWFGNKTGAW